MTSGVQAGWYQQPDGSQRYWDGQTWTDHVVPPPPTPLTPAPLTPNPLAAAPPPPAFPSLGAVQPHGGAAVGRTVAPKSPGLALLGSFFIPGLGQFINGNAGLGVLFLCLWLVSFPLMLVIIGFPMLVGVWIWSMVDAYTGAQKWNAQHGILS